MFAQFAARYLPDLNAYMRQIVDRVSDYPPEFYVMLQYALGWVDQDGNPYSHPTGKRIRPLLLLLCAEAAGSDWQKALPAAASVELLHNFSLIHDDIQDDSPTRHKRPTVWKIWGRANAINAGDAMFALAYCALEKLAETSVRPEIAVKTWRIFNNMALELTRGQHLDMRFENQPKVSVDEYLWMIEGKSAALIAACAQMGALVACGDDQLADHYADFGLNLGLAFQIHDDILGIWGDPSVTGKSTATDIASHKKSLPVLYALSQSDELIEIYKRTPFGEADVQTIVHILDQLNARDYTHQYETRYYQQALASLERAHPSSEAGEWLKQLVGMLFERQY